MPSTRRLHSGRSAAPLPPYQPASSHTDDDSQDDEDQPSDRSSRRHRRDQRDVLLVPSDVRRRLAANRTVDAFEKLRQQEQEKNRIAAAKAEEIQLREAKRRKDQAARLAKEKEAKRRKVKQEDRDEVVVLEDDEPELQSKVKKEPREFIVIKDESDEEDVKPFAQNRRQETTADQASTELGELIQSATTAAAGSSTAPRTPSPRPQTPANSRALSAFERLGSVPLPDRQNGSNQQPELHADQANGHSEQSSATTIAPSNRHLESDAPWPVPTREELPWPEFFLRLEEVFRALNTVYAFCSARKHLATTFDTMRTSVEAIIKKELEVHHIAQLKSLLPDLITFAYVDADMLEVHLDGSGGGSAASSGSMSEGRRKALMRRAETDDAFAEAARLIELDNAGYASAGQAGEPPPLEINSSGVGSSGLSGPARQAAGQVPASVTALQEASKAATAKSRRAAEEYVLLFEFNDGSLQGPKATARGRPGMRRGPSKGRPNGKTNPALNSMPSTSSMKRLIDKRNAKFETAVCELLAACQAKDEDPVELLISAAKDHVPIDPQTGGRAEQGETPQKKKIRLEYLMNNPDERPPIQEVIEEMKLAPWWVDQVVPGGYRTIEGRQASYDGLTFILSQSLVNALWSTRKIEQFYLHQAEALNALEDGLNVIVSTSTSSGKSLIYQVPIVRALEEDAKATAMFIFPTKALAQDQKRSLQDLIKEHADLDEDEIVVATYDGDTDRSLRVDIRERANIIFTNPDMLHQSILPTEHHWRRYLRALKYIVVDELHTYNGLFGAHVSLIMRRLRRICHALGNRSVQFISASATVANPKEHMQTLFGIEDVEVITEDGSPCGKKEWLVWNPPLIDDQDPKQGRVSSYAEVSKIFRHLVERGVRTIIFTKVRRTCEIVISQIKKDLMVEHRHDIVDKVMSYRSGYSPEDRRKIETDMWKGNLLGIVATSALELGIDIGSLDAVIMLGFPYSISSLRQQSGRAGRRLKDSLTVLCCDPFPMDQHYARFPEDVFNQPDAALSVDLSNDFVLEAHLQCAAEEMPLHPVEDKAFFGEHLEELCRNRLVPDDDGFYHCRNELRPNPAKDVAIRGARQVTYAYIDATPGRSGGPRLMEEVEINRAIFEAFEGAVFMHQGRSYICKEISHDTRIARMIQADVNFHTRPRDHTDTDAVETHRIRALKGTTSRAYYGKVTITTHVWGYFKVDKRANILDAVDVDCPPFVRHTKGFWIDVPMWIIALLTEKQINAAAAIHAAEHALLSLTPLFVVSLAGDVKTECKIAEREYQKSKATTRKRPARLIFYDQPGQNGGVCEKSFSHLDGLIRIAVAVIEACECVDGCPGCVTSQTCSYANQVTSKLGALAVLRGLIGLEPLSPDTPLQNEPGHASNLLGDGQSLNHTIEEAAPVRVVPGQGSRHRAGTSAGNQTQEGGVEVEQTTEVLPPSLRADLERLREVAQGGPNGPDGMRPGQGKSMLYKE